MAPHYENWHRALDVQMELQRWSITEYGHKYHAGFLWSVLTSKGTRHRDLGARQTEEELASRLESVLYRADTIFVTQDMQHVLLQAAHDLPDEIVFDSHMLLTPMGFCLFEEPMYGVDRYGSQIAVHAIAWDWIPVTFMDTHDEGEIISIYFFTDPNDANDEWNAESNETMERMNIGIPPLCLNHWYPAIIGQTIPNGTEPGAQLVQGILKLFVAMQLLAQQTIGEPMKMRPTRATRRRALSWDHDQERYITLITLRRKSVKKDDHVPQPVDWSHRWVVQGHWRRQYYPKTGTHAWKYIYEYVKGPEDKPLLIRERRVFNFRR